MMCDPPQEGIEYQPLQVEDDGDHDDDDGGGAIIETSTTSPILKKALRFLIVPVVYVLAGTVVSLALLDEYPTVKDDGTTSPLDLSHVKCIEDLAVEIDNIHAWCLDDHDGDTCPCNNPLLPDGRAEDERWAKVHRHNQDTLEEADLETLDVIFLGDSIIEGWTGNFYGTPDARVKGSNDVFQSFFSMAGKFNAIPLGISGDGASQLLWRLQHGELPHADQLEEQQRVDNNNQQHPLVYWILIGTNDLGVSGCSADVVIMGVIRIVEEIQLRQPSATVVINGLLPRTSINSKGFLMRNSGRKRPILWPTIQIINQQLERYAHERGENVVYFESHAFFRNATAVPDEELRIEQDLMVAFLHPNAEGYKRWGAEIVAKLESIFDGKR